MYSLTVSTLSATVSFTAQTVPSTVSFTVETVSCDGSSLMFSTVSLTAEVAPCHGLDDLLLEGFELFRQRGAGLLHLMADHLFVCHWIFSFKPSTV